MASSINKFFLIILLLFCSLIPTYFYCMSTSEEEIEILLAPWMNKFNELGSIINHAKKERLLQKQITLGSMVYNQINITDIKAQFDFTNQTVLLYANQLQTLMEIKPFLDKLSGSTRCHKKCSIQ